MNSEFNVYKLGEVAEIIAGGDKPKIFSQEKSELYSIPVFANAEKINGLQGYTDTPRIFESAVTVAARGSNVGFVAVRKEPFFPIVRLLSLIPKREQLDVDYLFYNLKQNRQNGTGSGQPQITIPDISNRSISLPALLTQQKVSKVLSSLDSKIELNNKINAELEAMAKTLYDYWFVQFDFPDANGKPYKTSGGKMVWNDELKREIPEGWEVLDLEKVESNIVTGKTPSTSVSEYFNGNIPFICIGDVRGNMHITKTEITLTELGAKAQSNKFIPQGAICVTCIASPGLVAFATQDSQTNQQLNSIVCKKFENRYYLYFYLTDFFKYSSAKTGNTFANMNKGDFSAIQVIKPKKEVLINFSNVLKSSIDKILVNSQENQELASLRDWLLPMLMNGQVSVAEVEKQLEMVAEPSTGYNKG